MVFQSSDLCDQLTVVCVVFQSSDLCDQLNSAELVCLREVLPVSVGTTVECMAYQVRGFHPPCARGDSEGILKERRKENLYMVHKNFHTEPCMLTAPHA